MTAGWLVFGLTVLACRSDRPPEKSPAPAAAPSAVVPPAPEVIPPPPAPTAPPSSPLRAALLAGQDLEGFRALAAQPFRLVELRGKRPPRTLVTLPRDGLDARLFEQKIRARLPHEPDPAGGEGEDFHCDDDQRSCVFNDEAGRATRYLFDPTGPKLREIQIDVGKGD